MRAICAMAALAASLACGGCHQAYEWDQAQLDRERFSVRSPVTVLGNGPRNRLAGPAWWDSRRDAELGVGRTRESGQVVIYQADTRDQLRTHGEHVRDNYRRTVRYREVGRLVR